MIGFSSLDEECPYQKDKLQRTQYIYMDSTNKACNHELVARGWRRFGNYFSRPVCKACNDCLSLRICVEEFLLSKSHKRIVRKNMDTKIIFQRPKLDENHLILYKKYHEYKRSQRQWKLYDLSFEQYYRIYVANASSYAFELDFYVDDRLVCVDFIDIVKDGISSVYCFYDPEFKHLNLGKYSLLSEIELAKAKRLKYIYLGYYVKNCPSLSYKDEYKPYELLTHSSDLNEAANLWTKEKVCK